MNNDLMRRIYEQICQHKETIIHLQEQSKSHPELFARDIDATSTRHFRPAREIKKTCRIKKLNTIWQQ